MTEILTFCQTHRAALEAALLSGVDYDCAGHNGNGPRARIRGHLGAAITRMEEGDADAAAAALLLASGGREGKGPQAADLIRAALLWLNPAGGPYDPDTLKTAVPERLAMAQALLS